MPLPYLLRRSRIALVAGSVAVLSLVGFGTVHALDTAKAPERTSAVPAIKTVPAAPQAKMSLRRLPSVFKTATALRQRTTTMMTGMASWYGSVLDGHRTASGEIFHKDMLTACHRTLPFGTMVRVIALATGKSVIVKINDRGVLTPSRVIDLSSGAAKELGILSAGVANVRLEIVKENKAVLNNPQLAPAF